MKETILITGGAGYIGSHVAYQCARAGYRVIIIDSLLHKTNHIYPWAEMVIGCISNRPLLEKIFSTNTIASVIHLAARMDVGESVRNPLLYYQNNVSCMITLLEVMHQFEVTSIIFASSAAVYGSPFISPIAEIAPPSPINPYGLTKLMGEQILVDCATAHGTRYVIFRFFNVAGADSVAGLCEEHNPETHIIPLLIRAVESNTPFYLFGNDYSTPDGTAVRDFIHVSDIADAHLSAIDYLAHGGESLCCNLGSGTGTSMKQLLETVYHYYQKPVHLSYAPRRPGDPASLIADNSIARQTLLWKPRRSSIDLIVSDAIAGEQHRQRHLAAW